MKMNKLVLNLLISILTCGIIIITATTNAQTIRYVDDDAPNDPGPGNASVSDPLEEGSATHPFDAIQEGIDAAYNGDTVLVLEGTFTGHGNRDLNFNGKAITVRSESGAENCIIDCQGSESDPHRGFYFTSGEGEDSTVEGFTITNGYAAGTRSEDERGGGIYCFHSSPTIMSNIITNCTATQGGSGIYSGYFSSPVIKDNTILNNIAELSGGGICCDTYSSPTIANNLIAGNTAIFKDGGGIWCFASSPVIENNTISGNTAMDRGGAICCLYFSSPIITNTILWGNNALSGKEIYIGTITYPSDLTIHYSDVQEGQASVHIEPLCSLNWGSGMLENDPLFVAGYPGDYFLSHIEAGQAMDSPCVDSGDPESIMIRGTIRTDSIQDDPVIDMGFHYPTDDMRNPCPFATQEEQCAFVHQPYLPPFVASTIESQGGDLNLDCGDILVLSSGFPRDIDNWLNGRWWNPGCGLNPEGYDTEDCVQLNGLIYPVDTKVLAVSAAWDEHLNSPYVDWIEIKDILNITLNDWTNVTDIPFGPSAPSGTMTLTTLQAGTRVNLRVSDSHDDQIDTAIIIVPCSCWPVIVEATIDLHPKTLNLGSNGRWITCYIELPEGYDVNEIDVSTVYLEDFLQAENRPTEIEDDDGDGILDLMVKFDRRELNQYLLDQDLDFSAEVELTVSGSLYDETAFEGRDTIRVIDPHQSNKTQFDRR